MIYKPKPAQAGFLSFFENLLGINEVKEDFIVPNSQTIPLLKSAVTSTNFGTGGGDITIVNNSVLLPDSGPMGTVVDIEDTNSGQGQISIYVVRKGDNLSQIAEMFGVSINTIIWTNDIERGSLIKEGQTLAILPISGIQHIIKKGDTIKGIAKTYNGNIDEIINYNGVNDSQLATGDTIIIPNGFDPNTKTSTSYSSIYTIKKSNTPSYSNYYIKPSSGVKTQGLHGYNAVDLASSCGSPIVASASGDVTIGKSYGWNGGYGNYVVIKHANGTQTLYGHLNKNIVSTGWHVVQGQVIGYMGSTGNSTGCHIHFEIRGARNPF